MFKRRGTKKIIVTCLTVLLAGLFLAQPQKASAIPVEALPPGLLIYNPVEQINKGIGATIAAGLVSGASYFLNKLAYDMSTWIASGDFDNRPLFLTQDAGKYFAEQGLNAVGDVLGSISDNSEFLKKYKVNLCMPPDIRLQMWLKLAVVEVYEPKPRCSWDSITTAYKRIGTPGYWQNIGVGFTAGQNDLSVLTQIYGFTKEESARKALEAEKNKQLQGQAECQKDAVTGYCVTPVPIVNKEMEAQAPSSYYEREVAPELGAFLVTLGNGNLGAIFTNAGKLFLNNLAAKSMQKLLQLGFLSIIGSQQDSLENLQLGSLSDVYASGGGSRASAERAFADFLVPSAVAVDSYNYVGEMANCGDENNRGYLTCSIDQGLQSALAQAEAGVPLTIKEAIDKNYLHPDWVLYGPDFTDKNSSFKCALEGYCYSNLVKLRLWRILPVGFELAAKQSKPDSRVTLRNALAHFNDVNNTSGLQHLIDPDWVIKAPTTRCEALTYGSIYLASQNQRAQYCADPQSCVKEDATGQCAKDTSDASWGYCLREKNVWRLGGDSCDAQYNTCTAYTNGKGTKVAYLSSTLDKGFCSAQNTGCRGYSLERDANLTGWQAGKSIFLNKKAEQCLQTNEGCSKFIKTDGSEVDLKKATSLLNSDYVASSGYNCYGEKNGVGGAGSEALSGGLGSWPVNKADLYKIFSIWSEKQKTECGRFAGVCAAEEVGCERYTPDNGNPPIPGILSANDTCPVQCAGYETYIEQPTVFSSAAITASFIPQTAQACESNYVGCDEFINLENQAGEAKQYFSELRACSKGETDPSDEGTFYTWEGSDTSGYQLKSYTLKTGLYQDRLYIYNASLHYLDDAEADPEQSLAPPAYNTSNVMKVDEYAQKCNRDVYKNRLNPGTNLDPDCREFYDKNGKKSYRLYSKTITIDAARCQKFRKSESTETSCTDTGGAWDAQGFCVYLAIADEGRSCPAAANGCRAYKGNAGNNFQVIATETYENQKPGQSDGQGNQFSAESLSLNGVSLKVVNGTLISGPRNGPDQGKTESYLISFWLKGNQGDLTATVFPSDSAGIFTPLTALGITDAQHAPLQVVKINSEWATYTVGPFNINWDRTQASTTFKLSNNGGTFFIDNLVVKKMTDNIYIVKNSWNTPASCDNTLDDPYGASQGGTAGNPLRLVPQAQLSCANYKNSKFETATVKSFTSMCREEAVGCEKLTDTYNNAATSTYYYNVECRLSGGGPSKNISNQPLACKDTQGVARCEIAPNQSICLFDTVYSGTITNSLLDGLTGGAATDIDGNSYNTLIQLGGAGAAFSIPADREVYLVNDQAHQCAAENTGCQALGLVDYDKIGSATSTQTAYLKNSPDKYKDILCSEDAEGCESYTTTKGGLAYFRDPIVWGNKLCEWQENKLSNEGSAHTGWFKKGSNEGCYWDNGDTGRLDNYQVKPVGASGYDKKVGVCPVAQDTCSEFVDPLATSPLHPAGEPYFVLNNEKLDRSTCQGQASLKKGCVLFDETAKGSKLWSASTTYAASQVKNYDLVAPIDCGRRGEKGTADNSFCKDAPDTSDANNANLVLKVTRDRACGEWLACKSSYSVWDDKLGKYKKVCTEIGRCNQAPPAESENSCANWIDGTHEYAGKILTAITNPVVPEIPKPVSNYQNRQTGWAGMDFSGFSRPDWLPLEELSVVKGDPDSPNAPEWRLGKKLSRNDISRLITSEERCTAAGGSNFYLLEAWTCTGWGTAAKIPGACAAVGGFWLTNNGLCVQTPKGNIAREDTPGISCRSYPEAGAPLPNAQSLFDTQPINVSNTNLCSENIGEWKNLSNPFMVPERPNSIALTAAASGACDCNYTKAEYEGKTLFWQYDNPNKDGSIVDKRARAMTEAPRGVLPGICTDGPYIGMACSGAADCSKSKTEEGAQGTCAPLTKASRLLGWQGICVEEDTSQTLYGEKGKHPCLAWLPVDQTAGMYDIFNQHKEAGFDPQSSQLGFIDGPYYCTEAKRWENRHGHEINNVFGYVDCDGGYMIDGQKDEGETDPIYNPPLNQSDINLKPYFWQFGGGPLNPDLFAFRQCNYDPSVGYGIIPNSSGLSSKLLPAPNLFCALNYEAWNMRQFIREPVADGDEEADKVTMSFDCRPKPEGKPGWYYDPNGTKNESYNFFQLDTSSISCVAGGGCSGFGNFLWTATQNFNWAYSGTNLGNWAPTKESEEYRCTEMYKVGDNGANKANTQLMWEQSKKTFSGNKNCDPVGALALYTAPPPEGAAIINDPNAPKKCLKGKITDDPDLPESDGAFYQGGIKMQLTGNTDISIQKYFAQGFERWISGNQAFQGNTPFYRPDQEAQSANNVGYVKNTDIWDISENFGSATPGMAAVGPCAQADNCKEDSGANMTVTLSTTPGFGSTLLKFYAWADSSHMPLRSVVVDWGDGERVGDGVIGYYRNHRGLDASNQPTCTTDNNSFGLLLGKTCDSAPFNFSHTYTCLGASSVDGDCDGSGNPTSGKSSCWLTKAVNPPNGACVFIPRVSLQDNWGWCNGTCPGGAGGTGCYDATVKGTGECDRSATNWSAGQGPWTPYHSRIIVAPTN